MVPMDKRQMGQAGYGERRMEWSATYQLLVLAFLAASGGGVELPVVFSMSMYDW